MYLDLIIKSENLSIHTIFKIKFELNYVIETLRKHPAVPITPRKCNKDCKIPGTDFTIEAGTFIIISIQGIHHDPEYYPEPDKFDPERFSEENKAKRPPMTFLAFGDGPRICIGKSTTRKYLILLSQINSISNFCLKVQDLDYYKRRWVW